MLRGVLSASPTVSRARRGGAWACGGVRLKAQSVASLGLLAAQGSTPGAAHPQGCTGGRLRGSGGQPKPARGARVPSHYSRVIRHLGIPGLLCFTDVNGAALASYPCWHGF